MLTDPPRSLSAFTARNIQILQVFLLQDLQDLALNLALKIKLFLQDMKNLARYEKSCKNLARKICKIIFLQDLVQDLARKVLARITYFLQDGFTGYLFVQRSIKQYCIMATDCFIAATFDAIFGCLVSNGFENILLSTLIHFYPSEAS